MNIGTKQDSSIRTRFVPEEQIKATAVGERPGAVSLSLVSLSSPCPLESASTTSWISALDVEVADAREDTGMTDLTRLGMAPGTRLGLAEGPDENVVQPRSVAPVAFVTLATIRAPMSSISASVSVFSRG